MKLSAVKMKTVAQHCHTTPDDEMLKVYWDAAVEYVRDYTGLTARAADKYAALTVAALALVADMYYNRNVHVDNDKINRVVQSFLSAHDVNLLPSGGGSA